MNKMKLSPEGRDFIKSYEQLALKAYKSCPSERWYTIGWCHFNRDVTPDMVITEQQAEELLTRDICAIEELLNGMKVNFMQRQFDALCSLIFQIGKTRFRQSRLKKYIQYDFKDIDITDQMVLWVVSDGEESLPIKQRRVREANMFLGSEMYFVDPETSDINTVLLKKSEQL